MGRYSDQIDNLITSLDEMWFEFYLRRGKLQLTNKSVKLLAETYKNLSSCDNADFNGHFCDRVNQLAKQLQSEDELEVRFVHFIKHADLLKFLIEQREKRRVNKMQLNEYKATIAALTAEINSITTGDSFTRDKISREPVNEMGLFHRLFKKSS
jgi:hypothetical protein